MSFFASNSRLLAQVMWLSCLTWLGCAAPEPRDESSDRDPGVHAHYAPIIDGRREGGRDYVVLVVNRGGGLCTGTLVSERVVLTAKHCVQSAGAEGPVPPQAMSVGVGGNLNDRDTRWYSVAAINATPGKYSESNAELVGNDLSLLTLSKAPGIAPLGMQLDESPKNQVGKPATAVGFGTTQDKEVGNKYTVDTTIVGVDSATIEVAGTVCEGDSGGPLISTQNKTFGVVSYGTSRQCDGGQSFYQRIDLWAELIGETIRKSGDCANNGPEACDGFDNDCDKQIDEDCAALGETCKRDTDCASLVCGGPSDGKICTTSCDPLTPTTGCNKGYYCATSDGCEGVCLPGKAGDKKHDEPCRSDTECESLFCTDPGDGLRRCVVACRGDAGDCLAGEACVASADQCGSCVEATLVASLLSQDEPCTANARCRSGLCVDDGGTQYCAAACSDDGDCDARHHCRDKACVRATRGTLGGTCQVHGDCSKGFFCAQTDQGDFCTRECDPKKGCGDSFACGKAVNGMVCVPNESTLGGECASNPDCLTDRCHEPSGTCTRGCNYAAACGPGLECERTSSAGGLCLSPEAAALDPELQDSLDGLADAGTEAPPKDGGGGCAVLPESPVGVGVASAWLASVAGALAFSRRRRRAP